jgi:hypothetical protein
MALLEELKPGVLVKGILPGGGLVTVVEIKRHGTISVELIYKDGGGHLGSELLYRESAAELEIAADDLPWNFQADGALFRLTSEAYRIRLAYLFDPLIAVHTSLIERLPHQITAVYETMLGKQPLRYLLADDPGAGKTIMAGLLKNRGSDPRNLHLAACSRPARPQKVRRTGRVQAATTATKHTRHEQLTQTEKATKCSSTILPEHFYAVNWTVSPYGVEITSLSKNSPKTSPNTSTCRA